MDHPRLRGEKLFAVLILIKLLGSPPLARGKEFKVICYSTIARITPACAGKRRIYSKQTDNKGDHPRLRGEKAVGWIGQYVTAGSPPLARGKVFVLLGLLSFTGITPACAGKR